MSIVIYCDTGGYQQYLKQFSQDIELISFKSENKNKNIINKSLPPSNMTFDDYKQMPENLHSEHILDDLTFDDFAESSVYKDIVRIVGKENKKDIEHLDSAYKSKVDIFLTSDYDDIYSYKKELESILGFKIFLSTKERSLIETYIQKIIQ